MNSRQQNSHQIAADNPKPTSSTADLFTKPQSRPNIAPQYSQTFYSHSAAISIGSDLFSLSVLIKMPVISACFRRLESGQRQIWGAAGRFGARLMKKQEADNLASILIFTPRCAFCST
jgi:hypothetical protein